MYRILLVSIISSIVLIGTVGVNLFEPSQNTYAIKTGSCPDMKFLWEHTYGAGLLVHGESTRLKELKPDCVVFEGTVRGNPDRGEGDGDLKYDLDPVGTKPNDNWDLLNEHNSKGLVIEIICWDKPGKTYTDKWGPFCDGVEPRKHIPLLKQGDHVLVTGKWVQDIGYPKPTHAQWNEIHPVEKIVILK